MEESSAPESEGLFSGCTVSVSEVSCSEPGCVPLETVISILGGPKRKANYSGKVFKPLLQVVKEDVAEVISRLLRVARAAAGHPLDQGTPKEGETKKKKSLAELWAEDSTDHGEGCECCAPIQ